MNKLKSKKFLSIITASILIGSMSSACVSQAAPITAGSVASASKESKLSADNSPVSNESTSSDTSDKALSKSATLLDTSSLFTEKELEQTVNLSNAQEISLESGKDVEINEAGVYVVRGSASEVTIKIKASAEAEVDLVFDGASISNTDSPVVYVESAAKVYITSTENSDNSLEVSADFVSDSDNSAEAVIFASSDLVLKGMGKLKINSAKGSAVISQSELKISGGTYEINSAKDAFDGSNAVLIKDGNFTVSTSEDAVHSENEEDNTKGYVYISGGKFTIDAGDDGIQSTTFALIEGGEFSIKAAEGIESTSVQINEGNIEIEATDDGINAAEKSSAQSINLKINGNKIKIVMAEGDSDAIDSNGNLTINGGTIDINAASAFDFDGEGRLNGGEVSVNGEKINELSNQFGGTGNFGEANPPEDNTGGSNNRADASFSQRGSMRGESPEGNTRSEQGRYNKNDKRPEGKPRREKVGDGTKENLIRPEGSPEQAIEENTNSEDKGDNKSTRRSKKRKPGQVDSKTDTRSRVKPEDTGKTSTNQS